jgi:flagellar hook-associated protein 1 FlgK
MGTINSALSLITQGLDADQAALNTVANNVANANTTGYTNETANFQENDPLTINGVSYGAGVTETGSTSVRDNVLTERLDQQQQLASASSSRLTALNTVQAQFTPASGSTTSTAGDIGSDLTSFFSSFSSLEANPSNNTDRQQVLSSAGTLAGDVSSTAASLNSQRSALDQEASGVTSQVNALTGAIAQLNLQIQSTSSGGDAGTLEDQRQQDLSQLSQLIGINQVTTENNGLSITTTSGQLLVSEGSSIQLTSGTVSGVTHFFLGTTDVTSQLASGGGTLGGYLTARDQDIPSVLSSLDQLAYYVSTEVNTQNSLGSNLNGDSGSAIFATPAEVAGSAAAMSVVMTDPDGIAASASGEGTGDGSNAAAMSNLGTQAQSLIVNGETILNGQTPIDYYSSLVTTLGSTVSGVETENTAQNASVTQLQSQSNALSGVNLNDEASAMTTFERSYQAASQVFTMLNTIMASALNLGSQATVS